MKEDLTNFLKFWFDGFSHGLEQLDPASQDRLLSACGLACARSYTAQIFRQAWEESQSMKEFLIHLAENFPEASYEYLNKQRLIVRYDYCACDLVKNGWVKSPILCKCSQNNLRQNFEQAMGKPVKVRLNSSLLGGADKCCFEVKIEFNS